MAKAKAGEEVLPVVEEATEVVPTVPVGARDNAH